ncbi:transcription factor, contains a PHD finger motif [Dispira simplex]|nr:transcription factor, contains a PHD finger motif [Dispira simplex]
MWPDIENPPGEVQLSTELTHTAPQVQLSDGNQVVTNAKGYRMTKATHGVTSGTWYYEATLLNDQGAVRIGWSQISGDLQGPCGMDHYSYSFRNQPATRFHNSCGHTYGQPYHQGDVLGVLISLPSLTEEQYRDLRRRRFVLHRDLRYTAFDYVPKLPTDGHMPVVPHSNIVYFLNGECLGTAYEKLYLGKYYPAIACYMGAQVRINFGPDFHCPPPTTWQEEPVNAMSTCPAENYIQEESDHPLDEPPR